tara:strand:+ start:691 stop:1218 length:528 start_codon:yes stop_codon:yes gene_type:complete
MNLNKIFKFSNNEVFSLLLIFVMVFSRLIPHPPNFTPIIAIGLMSGYYFKDLNTSIIVLLISMLLSDLFIGFYSNMFFVYLSLILITVFSFKLTSKISAKNLFVFGFMGSLLFFLVSNFGVWLFGSLYSKNFAGLIECYVMGIPFFKNTLISTIIYSYVGFSLVNFYSVFRTNKS